MGSEFAPVAPETAAVVALLRAARRPPGIYADLIEGAGSARAVLEQEEGLLASRLLDAAAADSASWIAQGIRPVSVLDPGYPQNLRAVYDRPPLVFVRGQLEPRDIRSVAVIGSRRATPAGLARARAISAHLVETGYTVVSGLAAGIDSAAHKTALQGGGRTVAVIGTGLQRAYPRENAALQREIADTGAVISQFMPDAGPTRENFPRRNAVMSGLTVATVIVEATQTSGARTQASAALAQGRPVLLASALVEQPWARSLADRPGVYLTGSLGELDDVLDGVSGTGTLVA